MLLLMLMLPMVMIPLVGLAIDGTMCFIVQAKLSAAVDGAALGAGRLLGTNANTTEIAGEFLNVDMPNGYWGSKNLTPTITATSTLNLHTINVSATVDVPLLFLRIFGQQKSVVAAAATATRADTRVMLVLDRSGSMNNVDAISGLNVFPTMVTSAKNFVGMFTPGTDELGMVAFDGSAIVGYPTTRPYDGSPTSATQHGPDTSFATSSTSGPMFTQINLLNSGGATNTSEALNLAFIELQKAHRQDLNANGADSRLNSIVLFTDGVPTNMTVYANDPTTANTNSLKPFGATAGKSPCTNNPATAVAGTQMKFWMGNPGDPVSGWGTPHGLHTLSAYDNSQTLAYWLGNGGADKVSPNPVSSVAGCNYLNNMNWTSSANIDLRQIPPFDLYGDPTNTIGYTNSFIVDATGNKIGAVYNGTSYDYLQPTNPYHTGISYWNAADNAGKNIRGSNAAGLPVAIYTIAYSGNGGSDRGLLKRLANTQDSTSYDPTQQSGMYVEVHSADQLNAAFSMVASELLRLAK
jgi:hypothetical protein